MKSLIPILLLIFPIMLWGQLSTNPMSPSSAVQDILLGPGVTVSNISFNGQSTAIGYFNGANTNLGMNEGLIMTTGTIVNNGAGPHGPNNKPDAGVKNGIGGFGLLSSQIGGAPTFNAAILEFDFVPYSDTVRFKYIFGSEEYPEYVGSPFNDVFGFFISGPGISGLQNIAKLPNGQAVAINNVNANANSAYFISNGDGSSSPQNGSSYYIQYDGFTKVLTAESKVQCGQKYHLIIAIADTGDEIYDSGIFLEANSLTSKVPVEVSHQLSQNLFNNPNVMAENCVSTTVTLSRGTNNINTPLTIPISVSGTATEGVDFSNIPGTVTFPAGSQTVQFTFDAFGDLLTEGQESIILAFTITDPCGNENDILLNLFINDVLPVDVEIQAPPMECPDDVVTLTAVPLGGAPPYTFLWSNGQTGPSISVTPTSNTTYSVTMTDGCLFDSATDDYEVIVPVFDPLTVDPSDDIVEICPYLKATISAIPSGGSGNYTYQWSSTFSSDIGNTQSIDVIPSTTTTYHVVISDNCGNMVSADILYTITSPPLLLTMSNPVEICPGDSTFIEVTATGGYGDYYYLWSNGATTSGIWVRPDDNTDYTVVVHDECATFTVSGSTSVSVIYPTADFEISSRVLFNGLPITFHNLSSNASSYDWDFGDGNQSIIIHPQNTYVEYGYYVVTLIATNYLGCKDTIQKPINIEEEWYIYIPNTFTPDGNRYNDLFFAKTIGIRELTIGIYNRWGELIFSSDQVDFKWNGINSSGELVNDGTYTYKVKYLTNSGRRSMILGHVNILR